MKIGLMNENSNKSKRNRALTAIALASVILMSLASIGALVISNQNAFASQSTLEKIDVRARGVTVTLPPYGTITAYHLFLIYTDKHGSEFICQGFPFDPATGQIPPDSILFTDPPGLLTLGHCIDYLPGNRDYIPDAPSITVASGTLAHKAYNCFVEKTDWFNTAGVPYHLITGPNSNSYAFTMLDHCNVPTLKPSAAVITPGWGISIDLIDPED